MRTLFLICVFLPCFCFSQERLVTTDDDVRLNGKLNPLEVKDQRSIDSVLGKPDSIYKPIIDGEAQDYSIASYPNAEFTVFNDQEYRFQCIIFTKRKNDFFVSFGTQILTAKTTMHDIRKHFLVSQFHSSKRAETISGRHVKVRELATQPPVIDGPVWIFYFFRSKLVKMTIRYGAA